MLSALKRWLMTGVAVLVALLYVLAQMFRIQRDSARRDAEAAKQEAATANQRIEQRRRADEASAKAKAEGDKRIEEAVQRARAGDRTHFERGLRDN